MKTVNLFLGLLLALCTITGCSSDDENTNSVEESKLIGLWYSEPSADPEMTLEFTTSHRTHFTYHEFGNNGQDIKESGDWELNGNTLKIYWNDSDEGLDIYNANILELTDTKLKWRVNIDGDDYIETYTR